MIKRRLCMVIKVSNESDRDAGPDREPSIQPTAQEARQGRQGYQIPLILGVSTLLVVLAYAVMLAFVTT